jgi:nicotinate dehydrogenase subunit A
MSGQGDMHSSHASADCLRQMSSHFDLIINGRPVRVSANEQSTLLDVLRNDLGLRATRFGCGTEQCGACMVLIDGEPAYACTRLISTLPGQQVVTVEGLAEDGSLEPLQQAFIAEQAGQCGFCLSGILVSAKALLDRNPAPSRGDIVAALDRNLCRCGAHNRMIRAIQRAASARSGTHA